MDIALLEEVVIWVKNFKKCHAGETYYRFTPEHFPPKYQPLLRSITHVNMFGEIDDPEEMSALYDLCNLEFLSSVISKSKNALTGMEWSRFTNLTKVSLHLNALDAKWQFGGCERLQSVKIIGRGASTALTSLCTVTSLTNIEIIDTSDLIGPSVDFSALIKLERLSLSGVFSQFPQGLHATGNLRHLFLGLEPHHAIEKIVGSREIDGSSISSMTISSEIPIEWNARNMPSLMLCYLNIPNIMEIIDDFIQCSPQLRTLSSRPLATFEIRQRRKLL